MIWTELQNLHQLDELDNASHLKSQLIFKHSTRCNISADAYAELQSGNTNLWFLDLLKHRDISDEIAKRYQVAHKSPQVLIISDGMCIYNESHWNIKKERINEFL